jgi:hypothetical protein
MVGSPDTAAEGWAAGLSPEQTLSLVEDHRRRAAHALQVDPRLLYGVWGVAWGVGFAAFWVAAGGPQGGYRTPPGWVGAMFGVVIVTAVAVTAIHVGRATRGVRGVSAQVGAMYAGAWWLGFAGFAAVLGGLVRAGASEQVLAVYSPAASCLLVGVLYLAGGAIWRDRVQYGLGGWIVAVTAAGALTGLPGLYLVMSVAGGGGFLLAAAWFAVRGMVRR